MMLLEKKYGCKFSKKLNPVAIEYYMTHAQRGPSCHFFLEKMVRDDDYTLDGDELDYLNGHAVDSYSELFEAFLYAAAEDVRENPPKGRSILVMID